MNQSTEFQAYKAFNPDMTCRGFQYEVGKTYEHDGDVEMCLSGFHACTVPFDCWDYYPGSTTFASVTYTSEPASHEDDSKVVGAKITIEASLSLPEWIKRQVSAVVDLCKSAKGTLTDSGHAAATGDRGHAAATGDRGHAAATGYRGHAAATGYRGHAAATGKDAIAASLGYHGTAQAGEDGWLVLSRHDDDFNLIEVRAAKVGTEGIKPNVRYRLTGNGFEEVSTHD